VLDVGPTCGTVPPFPRCSTRWPCRGACSSVGCGAIARLPEPAVVVGSGPNGLAAAIVLARAGRRVVVLEGEETVGGGCRSAELTLPGFVHDTCSTVHALALASPLLRNLPLADHGLEFAHPPAPLAHPLDDGTAVMLERSVAETAARLGPDEEAYRRMFEPLVRDFEPLVGELLGPLRPPRHPLVMARFATSAVRSAAGLARSRFRGRRARALLAGCAAHSMLSLRAPASAAFGIVLAASGHAVGWPVARGGSQRLADALAAHLGALGGAIELGHSVTALDELAVGRAPVLLDVTPRQLIALAGGRLPEGYRRRLARFRYGPGVFKLDWALDGPIPWAAPEVARAGTVHLGGTLDEVAASERAVGRGEHPERPFVLLVQASGFDPTRAPAGRHTVWAYCHVPNGSTRDMTTAIEAQIERFAPGFRRLVAARTATDSAELERRNPNYVGGDINGGLQDARQLFTRPVTRANPYSTPLPGVLLCSSSTPPGGGVHGMCGYWAARSALRASRSGRARVAEVGD
jgi:phytoene dehydrogenase-like protein